MMTSEEINQFVASNSLLRKSYFLFLVSLPSHLHPPHFIAFNSIDLLADKRQLSAQIYMWELSTLHGKAIEFTNEYVEVFFGVKEHWRKA